MYTVKNISGCEKMKRFEKIFLIGNGRVADDCLRELHMRGIDVNYIGIGNEKFPFTEKLCKRCGIEFCHVEKKDAKEFLLGLSEKSLIISAHNSYIFPAEVVEKENVKIINLHIAYLPEYRGMNPPTWAIFDQAAYAGASWHEVDAGIDSGGIIVQEKVPVLNDDTAMSLMLRCFQTGVRLFKENLDRFLSGNYKTIIPDGGKSKLYLAKELPNGGIMDLEWEFEKAYAFLRSMDYRGANLMPFPRVEKNGKKYEIIRYQKETEQNRSNGIENKQTHFEFDEGVLKIGSGNKRLTCQLREAAAPV